MNLQQLKQEAREEALYRDTDLYSFRGDQLDTLIDKVVSETRKDTAEWLEDEKVQFPHNEGGYWDTTIQAFKRAAIAIRDNNFRGVCPSEK